MTAVHDALKYQLQNLSALLGQIDNEAYCHQSKWLSGASIGKHTRHVIELIQCLVAGYEDGLINYDLRKRDQQIETNKDFASHCIQDLLPAIARLDKELVLEGSFDTEETFPVKINSTFNRELVYNIEHAVHHMALIKVGLKELSLDFVSEDFGVAFTTVQYRKICAQ